MMAGLSAPLAAANTEHKEQLNDAKDTLAEASTMVRSMKSDEGVRQAMQQAEAVFLLPNYGRAAALIGGAGGEGVLLVNDNNQDSARYDKRSETNGWSQPMFYNMGAINAGAQMGVEAGQVAMLLMTPEAVGSFVQQNNFSLNADAGLTIVDFSERAQATAGKGDIVIWSDTEGAYAGASVNIESIVWDDEENEAFYGNRQASPTEVMAGRIQHDRHNPLNSSMPGRM